MSNNTHWSADDLKKKGLAMDANGNYVPVSSLTAKGKVTKLPNLLERAIDAQIMIPKGYTEAQRQALENTDYKNHFMPVKNSYALTGQQEQIIAPHVAIKKFIQDGFSELREAHGETFQLPDGGYIDVLYSFDLAPVSAPRMTQSDKWKTNPNHEDENKRQRSPVTKYFKFKRDLLSLCAENGYNLTERLNILFVVPFPRSYNAKKRAALNNQPHDQKPDIDNFSKAVMDCLSSNDRFVWDLHAIKVWGEKGRIIIF